MQSWGRRALGNEAEGGAGVTEAVAWRAGSIVRGPACLVASRTGVVPLTGTGAVEGAGSLTATEAETDGTP